MKVTLCINIISLLKSSLFYKLLTIKICQTFYRHTAPSLPWNNQSNRLTSFLERSKQQNKTSYADLPQIFSEFLHTFVLIMAFENNRYPSSISNYNKFAPVFELIAPSAMGIRM